MFGVYGRSGFRKTHLATLVLLSGWIGCAHGPLPWAADQQSAMAANDIRPVVPLRPRDHREARELIELAFQKTGEGDDAAAAALFRAVLASDLLTDRGRANLYWVVAGIYRDLRDPENEAEALGAYLIASDLLEIDAQTEARRLVARSVRAALRVREQSAFGRSPNAAIQVEDTREPSSILASLGCGSDGNGRYLDVSIDSYEPIDGNPLQHRKATCDETGDVLELWFDMSYARTTDFSIFEDE